MLDIRGVAEVCKDFSEAVAVIGGGAWTVYTFSALGTRARAQAEQYRQAVVEVQVTAKVESYASTEERPYVASVVATVTNKGTRNTFIKFDGDPPFRVYQVRFDDKGVGNQELLLTIPTGHTELNLRAGATHRFFAAFRFRDPGLYTIIFNAPVSKPESKIFRDNAVLDGVSSALSGDVGPEAPRRLVWAGETYIYANTPDMPTRSAIKNETLSLLRRPPEG